MHSKRHKADFTGTSRREHRYRSYCVRNVTSYKAENKQRSILVLTVITRKSYVATSNTKANFLICKTSHFSLPVTFLYKLCVQLHVSTCTATTTNMYQNKHLDSPNALALLHSTFVQYSTPPRKKVCSQALVLAALAVNFPRSCQAGEPYLWNSRFLSTRTSSAHYNLFFFLPLVVFWNLIPKT